MRKAFSLSFIAQTLLVLGCLYGIQFLVGVLSAVRRSEASAHLCVLWAEMESLEEGIYEALTIMLVCLSFSPSGELRRSAHDGRADGEHRFVGG